MINTLQNIIKELRQGSHLELVNENFSNEIILNQSVQSSILGDITFFKVDFRNVDFIGSHVVACNFKNCLFDNVMLIKCEFWNSTFENCQIENCNLTRAAFYDGNFKDCNFINVNLTASNFSNFEFIETKFKNSKLDFIGVRSIKVSRSKQSIEIEKSSNLEKILKDMNLIISTDQDEIENS
jgi:uncharacterized protein YjbI with pentapeptide repeats